MISWVKGLSRVFQKFITLRWSETLNHPPYRDPTLLPGGKASWRLVWSGKNHNSLRTTQAIVIQPVKVIHVLLRNLWCYTLGFGHMLHNFSILLTRSLLWQNLIGNRGHNAIWFKTELYKTVCKKWRQCWHSILFPIKVYNPCFPVCSNISCLQSYKLLTDPV